MTSLSKALLVCCGLVLAAGCTPKNPGSNPDGGSSPDGGGTPDGGAPDGGGGVLPHQVTVHARGLFPHEDEAITDAWVAYRDGDGPWQQVQGGAGTYQFPVEDVSGRYTLATHCPNTKNISIYVETTAERAEWTMVCPIAGSPAPVQLNVVTNSWPAGSTAAYVHVSDQQVMDSNEGNTDHMSVYPRDYDAFAYVLAPGGATWLGASLQHAVDCTSAATLTFPMTVSPVPVPVTISSSGSTSGTLDLSARLLTARGTISDLPIAPSASTTFDALPGGKLEPGDFHLVSTDYRASNGYEHGVMAVFAAPPSSLSLVSPPDFANLTVTADNANGELMPSVTWSSGPPNNALVLLEAVQLSPVMRTWTMRVSPARLGGPGTVTFPNLTSAPGYDPNNSLDPTQTFYGDLTVMAASKGTADGYIDFDHEDTRSRNFVDGQVLTFALASFTWNP